MGNLLFETGNSKHAIKYHMQALKLNPKEPQALSGLGNAHYDLGQYKESVDFF
jgi:tetratricopeptide (TPR) repeat protein